MASSVFADDLTCSLCLSIFSDPVTLLCGHSFCRQCAADALAVQPRCPHCSLAVVTGAHDLPSSFILRSLAEKARAARSPQSDAGPAADLCPQHEEKLKLFCVTDQQLTCIICRDSQTHEGHKFKPVKEADAALRKELEMFQQNVSSDISTVEDLANKQREEITKSKEKSANLMTQISNQFEQMHEFLRKREKQIKNELEQKQKDETKRMDESLSTMETVLSESRELQVKVNSALEITDSQSFLKRWTEDTNRKTTEDLFRSRASQLRVENTSLSLAPYESHLQFFVWKEMLEIIQPRAERLSLTNNSPLTVICNNGRSLIWNKAGTGSATFQSSGNAYSHNAPSGFSFGSPARSSDRNESNSGLFGGTSRKDNTAPRPEFVQFSSGLFGTSSVPTSGFSQSFAQSSPAPIVSGHAFSSSKFTSGQHYWEVDVGQRDRWKLGIKDYFLDYDRKRYAVRGRNITREVTVAGRPQKIGLYLNCSSMQLSFYDADTVRLIDTVDLMLNAVPASAYFYIQSRDPDRDPLTVCWY